MKNTVPFIHWQIPLFHGNREGMRNVVVADYSTHITDTNRTVNEPRVADATHIYLQIYINTREKDKSNLFTYYYLLANGSSTCADKCILYSYSWAWLAGGWW